MFAIPDTDTALGNNYAVTQENARSGRHRCGPHHRFPRRLRQRQRERLVLHPLGLRDRRGFGKNEVPILYVILLVARGYLSNVWSVTVQPMNTTGFADAKAALEKAGYTVQSGATDSKAVYTNDKYTVAIGTPGVSVTYTVTAN